MPEALQNETRPKVVDAKFEPRERRGHSQVRQFEGMLYNERPSTLEAVLGLIAIRPPLERMVPTAEVEITDSGVLFVHTIRSTNDGLRRLEEDPRGLLEDTLINGKIYTEL